MCLLVGLLTNVYVKMLEEIALHFKQYDQELFVAQNEICEEIGVIALQFITSWGACCRFSSCKNWTFSGFSRFILGVIRAGNDEVFLRVTNHTGQAEKNLLGPAGIRGTSPMLYQLSYRSSWELVVK